ncbi:MAG TPA: Sua5/YciO/YrdC/YwlC family protein, partial [Gaiellales bacterium]|nr:Sua5/YciO/YrdC/YwlC family protein [Gaiellales bacterium]
MLPTDTVYGIACAAGLADACAELYALKERPAGVLDHQRYRPRQHRSAETRRAGRQLGQQAKQLVHQAGHDRRRLAG